MPDVSLQNEIKDMCIIITQQYCFPFAKLTSALALQLHSF